LGDSSQLLVGIPANFPADERIASNFWLKTPFGTGFETQWARINGENPMVRKKGE
jgi:hypothetical protein